MTSLSTPFELIGSPDSGGPFVFTCEHATNRVPSDLVVTETDQTLLEQHWGWDIGSSNVVRELVDAFASRGVLAGYTRLVIDLNRDPRSDDLILLEAEGIPISFNQGIDDAERKWRFDGMFAPYHRAVDDALDARKSASPEPFALVSIHSFTPVYNGHRRELEVGVLFDKYEELAVPLADKINAAGLACELNQPYSGKPPNGLIYSAASHGESAGVPFVELEIRHDLIDDDAGAQRIATALIEPMRFLAELLRK